VRLPEMRQLKILAAGRITSPSRRTEDPPGEPRTLNAVAVVEVTAEGGALRHEIRGTCHALVSPHDGVSRDGAPLPDQRKNQGDRDTAPTSRCAGMQPGTYGPTLLKGSLPPIPLETALANLESYTAAVKRNAQLDPASLAEPGRSLAFNPSSTSYTSSRKTGLTTSFSATYPKGGRPDLPLFRRGIHAKPPQAGARIWNLRQFLRQRRGELHGHTWTTTG